MEQKDRWMLWAAAIITVVLIIAALVVINLSNKVTKLEQNQKVKEVEVRHVEILNADILRTEMEERVQDSIQVVKTQLQKQLNAIKNENAILRTESRQIRAYYDSVYIERPVF